MKARPLYKVIRAVLSVIPDDETELRSRLDEFLKEIGQEPPELIGKDDWWRTRALLVRFIPLDSESENWRKTVHDIFVGELDYREYLKEKI